MPERLLIRQHGVKRLVHCFLFIFILVAVTAAAEQGAGGAEKTGAQPATVQLSLDDAIQRAKALSPEFQTAASESGIASLDKTIARAALLPQVIYNNQYLYTQGNGTPSGRFIANNGVHEYLSQGNLHQVISAGQFSEYRRAHAAEAVAKAKLNVATRGLVATVVQDYFSYAAAQRKLHVAEQAAADADRFLKLSQQLEEGGEVAHADVIKAQLQSNDRQRDLREAQLAEQKSRLDLAVLTMPDLNESFTLTEDLDVPPALPSQTDFEAAAKKNNPELAAALSELEEARQATITARSGYLPALTLDYWYGIDANRLAVNNPDGTHNLGYAASATLNIPVWDWGAIHSKVKQSELKQKVAQTQLSFAQRQLVSEVEERYDEATAAFQELETLRNSANLAEESLRLTELRYRAGEATVLELVDAENSQSAARNAYADGEVRYRVALAGLETMTGKYL